MEETVKERLIKFLKYKSVSKRAFEIQCGLSNGYVSNIRVSIQPDKIEQISKQYPDLNTGWLLTGEGEMLKSDTVMPNDAKMVDIQNFMNIPLVPVRASAGYLVGYGDRQYIDTLPTVPVIVDKTYKGKYRCFEVDGDSMDDGTRDAICDKDIILGREVKRELWSYKLHLNDWDFVIVHKEGVTIKRITEHNTETGVIKCHPLNPIYEDFELNLNDVYELYNVIKIVDRSTRR